MFNVSILLAAVIYSSIIVLGWTVYNNNRKDRAHRLFFIFALLFTLWLTCNFLQIWLTSPSLTQILLLIDFSFAPFFCLYLTLFLLNFPINRQLTGLQTFCLYVPTFIASALVLSGLVIGNIEKVGHKITFTEEPLFPIYGGIVLLYSLGGILWNLLHLRQYAGHNKKQIFIILWGFGITFIFLFIGNVLLQNILPPELFVMVNFSSLILVGSITVAVLYYRFMGLRSVLRNSFLFWMLFGSTYLLFVLGYTTYTFLSQLKLFEPTLSENEVLIFFSMLFIPLFLCAQRITLKLTDYLFSTKVDVKQVLRHSIDRAASAPNMQVFTQDLISDIELVFSRKIHLVFFDELAHDSPYQEKHVRNIMKNNRDNIFYEDCRYHQLVRNGKQEKSLQYLTKNKISVIAPLYTQKEQMVGAIFILFDQLQKPHSHEERMFITMLMPQLTHTVTKLLYNKTS